MLHDWGVIAAAFGYIGFLFLVASHGDRRSPAGRGRASGLIYPLSLAIYCTSWPFFGSVPYIALQLKAVASSLETILSEDQAFSHIPIVGDVALMVTLAMAAFAVLFGTRQTDATEHQHGLMLAVATESIIKLVAFLAAGIFVTFWMFSPHELIERAMKTPEAVRVINYSPSIGNFLTMTLLS